MDDKIGMKIMKKRAYEVEHTKQSMEYSVFTVQAREGKTLELRTCDMGMII